VFVGLIVVELDVAVLDVVVLYVAEELEGREAAVELEITEDGTKFTGSKCPQSAFSVAEHAA